jgi:Bacterial Ig-like domain (group 3)
MRNSRVLAARRHRNEFRSVKLLAVFLVATGSIAHAQSVTNTLTTSDGYTNKTTPAGPISLVATIHPLSCTTYFNPLGSPNPTSCTSSCNYGSNSVAFTENSPKLVTTSVAIPSSTVQTFPCSGSSCCLGPGCACLEVYGYETATLPLSLSVGNYNYSASMVGQTIKNNVVLTITKDSPAISLATNPSVPLYHTPTSIAATLNQSFSPGGSVMFLDSGASIGSAAIASSTATLTTSSLSAGAHSITASYAGDANNSPANGGPLNFAVNVPAAQFIESILHTLLLD